MGFTHEDLDEATRAHMRAEVAEDVARGRVYMCPWLTADGRARFLELLLAAVDDGTDETFAAALAEPGLLCTVETDTRGVTRRVRFDAAIVLAELVFNRYFMRGLCCVAIERGLAELEVYRARASREPRPESEARLGGRVDPIRLLFDLRDHALELETELGVPTGPGSGLSVRRPRDPLVAS